MAKARPEPAAPSESARTRHETLYIDEGGLKTFAVKNTLFRVHTYFLVEHSAVLRDMLSIGKADDGEGASDDHPIVLPDPVKVADFARLLSMFYAPAIGGQTNVFDRESIDGCLSLLKLFEFLQMKEIRQKAVTALRERKLDPVDKLHLLDQAAPDFNKNWAVEAVIDLCTRASGPDADEGQRIGWKTFTLIWKIREKLMGERLERGRDFVRDVLYVHDREFGVIPTVRRVVRNIL
ncbi:hypothetical protein BD626DRAFT_439090 [Schizophyllum amplum]|uniref:BTB domain-containing protein n=1 Tax=Schizophyllum amplum TaxID=97359 RepID=A0A550BYR7_9AGAR|nr:hypothetical protein BD626DRAFT_439090 [Auriculariopsis ampla]